MVVTQSLQVYTETSLRVRYQETDQMGVVYHANYLVWFEVGRSDFIRNQGYSYQQFENLGLLLPVVEINCKYFAPARYDDEVTVRTKLADFSGGKMIFEYEVVRKADQERLVTGVSKHLWVNTEMKRVNVKRILPELYEHLTALCDNKGDVDTCSG